MRGFTKLDAALLALGVAVMDTWDRMPEGGTMQVRKIEGEPTGSEFVANLIQQVIELETGALHSDHIVDANKMEAT
jgi:hypothetical protein